MRLSTYYNKASCVGDKCECECLCVYECISCLCIWVHLCVCVWDVFVCVCLWSLYVHVCVYKCMYMYEVYLYICVCVFVCLYVCVCICPSASFFWSEWILVASQDLGPEVPLLRQLPTTRNFWRGLLQKPETDAECVWSTASLLLSLSCYPCPWQVWYF